MKAAVYYQPGGPEVFRYQEVPDPELAAGGVLIEVEAISVEGGGLRVVIDRSVPLAEAAAAHAYIESRQAFRRVLLKP